MKSSFDCAAESECMVAARLCTALDEEGFPQASTWEDAPPAIFCSDWQGKHADPQRETEVRLLWSYESLFVSFRCRYREINVYTGTNIRRDELWLRDVAEVFIQSDTDDLGHYREFEISPNGDWLDLDISPGRKSSLLCSLKSRVVTNSQARVWVAQMTLPMNCLARKFDPAAAWRLNFFRVEGTEPNRFYSAWRPTHTLRPNFHVPEVFGELHFSSERRETGPIS